MQSQASPSQQHTFSSLLKSQLQHAPLFLCAHTPADEQPMHFTPFFFCFMIYPTARTTAITIITATIKSVISNLLDLFFTLIISYFFYFAAFNSYSACIFLFVFIIIPIITTANASTAMSPGTKAVPRAPVVISVPI